MNNKLNTKIDNSLELKKYVLDSLSDGVLVYSLPNREILTINEEAKNLLGITNKHKNINNFISNKILQPNLIPIRTVVKNLKNPGDVIKYTLNIEKNNSPKIISVTTKLLKFHTGQKFILSTMHDITETERLNKMLMSERANYRDALIKNSEYFFSFDVTEGILKDDIILSNGMGLISSSGFAIPIKYDEFCEKSLEKNKIEFLTANSKNYLKCDGIITAYNRGITNVTTEHYFGRWGQYYRTVMLFSKDQETGHIHAAMIANNITTEKLREKMSKQALVDAYNSATSANKAKTDFLSRMSHDIRTPMNAIVGMTTIAKLHPNNTKKVSDCLDKIEIASKHLLALINDVLDMSKIESGHIDLQIVDFEISEFLNTLSILSKPQLSFKKQNFSIKKNDIIHNFVQGDVQRLEQVFMNFISNSIKYSHQNGNISLTVTEKPINKDNVACYEFVIEDNGIGMTDEFLKKIFEPFTRAEDERISRIQGTGLGMSIAKNIIEMMNGDINIKSKLNKGTKITVTLCFEIQKDEDKTRPSKNQPTQILKDAIAKNTYKGKKILLVEDNEINMEIAQELLSMAELTVETASNGKIAVDKVIEKGENYYDMILMDIQMPVMNGLEAASAIRALDLDYVKKVPIIAMTANAFSDDIVASKNAGMNEHISKPLEIQKLNSIIFNWLS